MYAGDDAAVIGIMYEDKRAHVWFFETQGEDNSCINYKYISNQLFGGHGITFIPWGSNDPDLSRELIKGVYVYDNVLGSEQCGIGIWPDNPMYGTSSYASYNGREKNDWSPIQDVSFINNKLTPKYDLYEVDVTNLRLEGTRHNGTLVTYDQSCAATQFQLGNFDRIIRSTEVANGFQDESDWVAGLSFWSSEAGTAATFGTEKVRADLKYSGWIKGDGRLFQGLYISIGNYDFKAKIKLVSGSAKMFVKDAITGGLVAEKPIAPTSDFEDLTLNFNNFGRRILHLGIEHFGAAGEIIYLDDAVVTRLGVPNAIGGVTDEDIIYSVEHERINVSSKSKKIQSVSLYDVSGRLLRSSVGLDAYAANIPVKGFVNGVYLLAVQTDRENFNRRVILH
jgi:hypothetical protein